MSHGAPGSAWLTAALTLGAGIVVGSWTDRSWGFAIGLALGYLLAQRLHLAAHIGALGERIVKLEQQLRAGAPREPVAPGTAPERAAAAERPVRRAAPDPIRPESASAPPAPAPAEPAAALVRPGPVWAAPPPAEPGPVARALAEGVAWLKRGNPVAKAGVVVLFFGAAFLAKYAADHSLLPLELRLAAIAAGAAALLVVGWRLRGARALYAQILQGGGIAGLYLTVFAAARLYQLAPHELALPLLIAIATASALLAVAQNALALAVIGFAGGFLAPILLSTGGGSHVALFTYYAVLNAGVFTVAWFRAWRVLNLVGFVFTFTITGAWRAVAYRPENLASADFFLLLFFAMYVAISVLFALRQKPELRGYVSGSLVFGLPVVVFSLHATLVSGIEYGLAFSALGFGTFYLALAWTLYRLRHENLRLLAEAFAALGVMFASLAVPLAFDHQTTAAMWAVEGAGLVWIGVRQDRKLARAFGVLLQAAGGFGYLVGLPRLAAAMPVVNTAYIGTLLLAVSGALTARWLLRHAAQRAAYERQWDVVALLWATAWFVYGGLAEIDRSVPGGYDYGAALAYGAVTLTALVALRFTWSWPIPARVAVTLLPLMALAGVMAGRGHPLAEWGVAGWPLLLAAGYLVLHAADAEPDAAVEPAKPWLHAGLYVLLAYLGAREAGWHLSGAVPGVWHELPAALVPVLLLWVANRAPPWPAWPIARHRPSYQRHASVPLAAWAALWLLAMNLSSSGDPAWIPYLPLLNPLDLTSALVLLALAAWVLALPDELRRRVLQQRELAALAGVIVFVWLNAALVRALHHGFDTPLTFEGIRRSVMVQASLSIFWTLLSLSIMFMATRKGWRQIWIVGAGLMAAVVLKLFAIDLEGTGTIARIASFISVGLLMLLAGYLTPLPPDAARKEST